MARYKRDALKRKLVQAHHHAGVSGRAIGELQELFQDPHPELAQGLSLAIDLLIQTQNVLEHFARGAWDMDKEVYPSYR